MNAKRAFFAMLGSIVFLVGLCAAGTYLAFTMLTNEGQRLLDLKLEDAVLDKQNSSLVQAKKDIAEYEGLEMIAKTVVPQEKDQARTTLELINLAAQSGITISSIEFPESLLGEAAKKSKSKTTTDGTTAPVKTVDSNTTQLTPLTNLKGVYTMEIQVESDSAQPISYDQLLTYLKLLENNRRTAQVRNISISPSTENRNEISFSLVLNSYVKP
jgi:hypothetical protein